MEEQLVLTYLNDNGKIEDSYAFAQQHNVEHQRVVGTIKSLEGDSYVISTQKESKIMGLTAEAEEYMLNGSPEVRVYNAVPEGGKISVPQLEKQLGGLFRIGHTQCMKEKWLKTEACGTCAKCSEKKKCEAMLVSRAVRALPRYTAVDNSGPGFLGYFAVQQMALRGHRRGDNPNLNNNPTLSKVAAVQDKTQQLLETVKQSGVDALQPKELDALKHRKLIQLNVVKSYSVVQGPKFALQRRKAAADLTTEMLQTEAWKELDFKPYNFKAMGKPVMGGHLHPLLKVRAEFREIFLEMGFAEMETNRFVESSFWNFDVLFQPQQHPARDAHDTFFLKSPAQCLSVPDDYRKRVQEVHEHGGYGSIGYRYNWKIEEAFKNVLRTHTTAVSSRTLYDLAQQKDFGPKKFFSIDRVFRNEEMDQTHLCEFHQIEGMVIDKNLSLGNMIALFAEFFKKVGIKDLKFKPAFNPYTEPSMEIFGYHPQLKMWVEVGNSGIFRPEMLLPMGFPEDVRVLAWGLSLERPTMIKYGLTNIRELVGHKVDLEMIRGNGICRLDK